MTSKTPEAPTPATSVSIAASDFHRLVKAVIPLADRGVALPVLNAVWLRGHGQWISATATDRYRVGVKRVKCEAPEGWQALIPLSALRSLLATFKPSLRNDPTLTLTPDGTRLAVSVAGLDSWADITGGTLHFRLDEGQYPKSIDDLLAGYAAASDPLPDGAAFNPHFLADFKAASEGGEPMRLGSDRILGNGKPNALVVRIGDHFIGAVIGARIVDAERPDWTDLFPTRAKEGAA